MKYYIDYDKTTGKILGFIIDEAKKQGEVVEVSKEIFEREMNTTNNNKIVIDGENITFEKVDLRTPEEIKEQVLQQQIAEAQQYLDKTDHKFYNGYKPKEGEDLVEIERLRDEAREFIRANEI